MDSPNKTKLQKAQYAMDIHKRPVDLNMISGGDFSSFEAPKQSHRLIPIPKLDDNSERRKLGEGRSI